VIMSAVEDALAVYGPVDIDMPATPLKIWAAIQTAHEAARPELVA